MSVVRVDLKERSYDIHVGVKLESTGEALEQQKFDKKIMVVSNPTVDSLYGEKVKGSLQKAGFSVFSAEVAEGEKYKTQEEANRLYDECMKAKLERQSAIVALGGGVIGDLTGFVAATFMRGVPFVQVPTTLLAQVDSSVGGKVAVNMPSGKNMVGVFYQPRLVYIDPSVLSTLPMEEFSAGMAEVIKYGVISDGKFFDFLEKNIDKILALNAESLEKVITTSCRAKADVVEQDEREKGLRAILNFGHTVAHALETLTEYKRYRHGEAVSIGMVCAARIAELCGICDKSIAQRLQKLLSKAGLPVTIDSSLSHEGIIELLKHDKKVKDQKVRFVLPESMGKVVIRDDIDEKKVREALSLITK
ncbi:MAG: 3-dehydroquinate synthase [bacterium]